MRRRRKRRKLEEVELNLAAMLDMAFQLLTFFILTFRPAPVEGQVLLRMPPPQPVTNVNAGQSPGANEENKNPAEGLSTLVVSAMSDGVGRLRQMSIGENSTGSLAVLEQRLSAILRDEGAGFDQVIIQVDSRLRYEELMQVVDICTRQTLPNGEKLSKLSFVELPVQ